MIFRGEMPNIKILVKIPTTDEAMKAIMEETQLIEVLYDWKSCDTFLMKIREELVLVSE